MIALNSSKNYEFHWCVMKKHREAGVGFLIPRDLSIIVHEGNISFPWIIAINLKFLGFNRRMCAHPQNQIVVKELIL